MTSFKILNDFFEKQKNISLMFEKYGDDATRYALLRSLDNNMLKDFLKNRNVDTSETKKILENAYNSNVTIDETVEYIMSKKNEILNDRKENEEKLINIVENMDIVNCGIRSDQVDDIIKPFVRNKNFESIDEINNELDTTLLPKIKNYVYWSCFNQLSNDLIENSFYSHPIIIPTLRKIHDIDFFIKVEGKIIPFDLKITHVSDEFFNTFSEGLKESSGTDTYISQNNDSEIKTIKNYYNSLKKEYNLQNYSGLSKIELLGILGNITENSVKKQIKKFYSNREKLIDKVEQNILPLEWWNYKYQGERLFCNNNRLFVFLAHKNSFQDGKDLKKEITNIREAITNKLDSLTLEDVHQIKYKYEKDPKFNGEYVVNCMSIIIIKD